MNEIKHHLVYLITNTVNGKIYVGKHETLDPDDDYMGSGKLLKRAQNKYGLDKFTKTILADFDEPWSMANMEAAIVDEEFIKRKDTYNITLGGNGGFYYAMKRWRALQQDDEYKKREQQVLKARWKDDAYREKMREVYQKIRSCEQYRKRRSEAAKKYFSNHAGTMTGKKHTPEALQKQHETFLKTHHAQGEKNSQYGKHWWMNPETGESHSFYDGDAPHGWVRGRRCKVQ